MVHTMDVRVYDLDGSVSSQTELVEYLQGRIDVVDLRHIGPLVRYLPADGCIRQLDEIISSYRPAYLAFTGSGDFHHTTVPILKTLSMPVSVIVFDQHSDWVRTSPFPCGSWIVDALELEHVARIIVIGTLGKSIGGWKLCHGPVNEFLSGRVEVYPYDNFRSKLIRYRTTEINCGSIHRRFLWFEVHWCSIVNQNWGELIDSVASSLPTDSVYISIDKDCLRSDVACTNWGSGELTLGQVVEAVKRLRTYKNVVGADITGEYSPLEVANPVLRRMAEKSRPRVPSPTPEDLRRNGETNIALAKALGL